MEGEVSESALGGVETKTMVIAGGLALLVVVIIIIVYYMRKPKTVNVPNSGLPNSSLPTTSPTMPFSDGAVVRCSETGGIYKVEGQVLRHYTPDGWAAAGSPGAMEVDCKIIAGLPQGTAI